LQRYAGTPQTPVVVLHAFGNDVYCGYMQPNGSLYFGCLPLPTCIEHLSKNNTKAYVLVGNGALMHRELFKNALGDRVVIPEIVQPYASITALGEQAWQDWQAKKAQTQIQPLYLKKTL
jgi:tRNA A37 threonylcarbamoyladenosine modification protein TsaB